MTGPSVDELVDCFQTEADDQGFARILPSLPETASPARRREHVAPLCTVRPPQPIPVADQAALDVLLDVETAARAVVDAATLPTRAASGVTGPLS